MKKLLSVILLSLVLVFAIFVPVSAASYSPYSSYEYNSFGESIAAPVGYVVSGEINAASLGLSTPFSGVCDLVVKNEKIYILDSENSRILRLDSEYNLEKIYENFSISQSLAEENAVELADGIVSFRGATGFAVGDDGKIYVADTKSNRVLVANEECQVINVILRPDAALSDTNASFSPSAIEVDDRNWVYVASNSIAYGMMVFDNNGVFQNFFGANEVLSTTDALVQFFRDTFMNLTQLEFVEQKTPVTITKMDFDKKGFVYTVSPYDDYEATTSAAGLIKKINFSGDNILESTVVFGDIEISEEKTWFVDVDVADNGFVNMLDAKKGRIFQYFDDGTLINVFGTMGDQIGCFADAVAIESIGNTILAADKNKNLVYIYKPTEYGLAVQNAMLMLQNGDFEGSELAWRELLKLNTNSSLAYKGLGRIYDYKQDYKTAMKYYKLAFDQEDYALAFKQQRQIFIKENIAWLLAMLIALFAVIFIVKYFIKKKFKKSENAYSRMEQKYTIEFYSLLHPLDGFSQFKTRNIASFRVSAIIVVIWFLSNIFEFYCTGFAFSINRSKDFSLFTTVVITFGLFAIFVISNWALCSLIDGKGTFKDITAVTAYSLIPFIVSNIISVIMTNFLVPSESVFISIVTVIGLVWSVAVLILGMISIHDFSVSKVILALLLTVFGMAVIVFIIILMFSLLQQMWSLVTSIYNEIIFRA